MSQRARAIALLLVVSAAAACGSSNSPSSPTPQRTFAVFTDSTAGFMTSDVRDVQEQIVRFDTMTSSLVWTADGRSFPGFPVSGNFIGPSQGFLVRFGTRDGQRRAYFTEAGPGTICDIEVVNGQLIVSPTSATVPGS
jgi:hypothetical protein